MLIDVTEMVVGGDHNSDITFRNMKSKADIPERYQQAVAMLDAVDHVKSNYAEERTVLDGVGRKFVWYNISRTGYYIESAFLEA